MHILTFNDLSILKDEIQILAKHIRETRPVKANISIIKMRQLINNIQEDVNKDK